MYCRPNITYQFIHNQISISWLNKRLLQCVPDFCFNRYFIGNVLMLLLNHVSYNMIKMSVRSKNTHLDLVFKKIKYKVIDSHSILLDAMPVLFLNKYQNQIKTSLLVDKAPGLLCQLSMIFFFNFKNLYLLCFRSSSRRRSKE